MRCKWLIFALVCVTIPALAEKFHLNPTPVSPAATGDVDIGRDNNGNTRIDLHVEHLARPGDLSPPMTTYVVWLETPNVPPVNAGELKVGSDLKASLKAVTPLRNFEILITGEQNPRTTTVTGPVVMRSTIHQG